MLKCVACGYRFIRYSMLDFGISSLWPCIEEASKLRCPNCGKFTMKEIDDK